MSKKRYECQQHLLYSMLDGSLEIFSNDDEVEPDIISVVEVEECLVDSEYTRDIELNAEMVPLRIEIPTVIVESMLSRLPRKKSQGSCYKRYEGQIQIDILSYLHYYDMVNEE